MHPHLILYTTLGCHLCEHAEAVVLEYVNQVAPVILDDVDIADSDELIAQFGERIPVISVYGREETLEWPFNLSDLVQFVQDCYE